MSNFRSTPSPHGSQERRDEWEEKHGSFAGLAVTNTAPSRQTYHRPIPNSPPSLLPVCVARVCV